MKNMCIALVPFFGVSFGTIRGGVAADIEWPIVTNSMHPLIYNNG